MYFFLVLLLLWVNVRECASSWMWSLSKQLFNNLFFGNINKMHLLYPSVIFCSCALPVALPLCITLEGWNIYARAILAFCIPILYTRKTLCMALYMVEFTLPHSQLRCLPSTPPPPPLQRERGGGNYSKNCPVGCLYKLVWMRLGADMGSRGCLQNSL